MKKKHLEYVDIGNVDDQREALLYTHPANIEPTEDLWECAWRYRV